MIVTTISQALMKRIAKGHKAEAPVTEIAVMPEPEKAVYDSSDIFASFREFCDQFKGKFDGPRLIEMSDALEPGEIGKAILRSPSFDNNRIERRELSSGDGWGYNPSIDYSLTFVETEYGVTALIERLDDRFDGVGYEAELEFFKTDDGFTASSEVDAFLKDATMVLRRKYECLSTPGAARDVDGVMPYPQNSDDDYDDASLHGLVYGAQR